MDKQNISSLLELVNTYPSPHNGQPIRVEVTDTGFVMSFEKMRGLQSLEISYKFSFVAMGVFIGHVRNCAKALGHEIDVNVDLPKVQDLRGDGFVKFASCSIKWNATQKDDHLRAAIEFRQTSRKKYKEGIRSSTQERLIQIAATAGMQLSVLDEERKRETVWLNQRAVFDDLFDESVRRELHQWLRFNKKQKLREMDGLAYDCMELNGRILKFIVQHPSFLRWPIVAPVLKRYYTRTMKDASSVLYLRAPFESEMQSFVVGEALIDMWIACSEDGYYIHPLGTVVGNLQAHKDFLRIADISDESRRSSYVCVIFRAGKSDPPVKSLRRPVDKHLMRV